MSEDKSDWDYKPKDGDFEVTELEALRLELRELKEEIKNKPQLTSSTIAAGVAGGIMNVIGTFVILYFGFAVMAILVMGITSIGENKPSDPPITLPPP